MKELKAFEILNQYVKDKEWILNRIEESSPHKQREIKIITDDLNIGKEAIAELETQQRYINELESDAVSLQNEYSDKCTELKALDNRSCMNCKHNEITICKKLPSLDWSFEPTNDFDCRKWESR